MDLGAWVLEAVYIANSLPCKMKALALYGLIFTALDYVAENTLKKPASALVRA